MIHNALVRDSLLRLTQRKHRKLRRSASDNLHCVHTYYAIDKFLSYQLLFNL